MINIDKLWKGLHYEHPDAVAIWIDPSVISYIRIVHRKRIEGEDVPLEVPASANDWVEVGFNCAAGLLGTFFPDLPAAEKAVELLIENRADAEQARLMVGPAIHRELWKDTL